MKPLGKAIKTARLEHRNWVQELSRFLLSYRTTPRCSTKIPPAQLLFNRPMRGALPMLNSKSKVLDRHHEAEINDTKTKTKGREYANKRRQVKWSDLAVGDKVLFKQRKKDKFTSKFESSPYTVIERKGTRIVAENQRHQATRNASFFKKIKNTIRKSEDEEQYNTLKDTEPAEREQNEEVQEPVLRRSTRTLTQRTLYGDSVNPDLVIR